MTPRRSPRPPPRPHPGPGRGAPATGDHRPRWSPPAWDQGTGTPPVGRRTTRSVPRRRGAGGTVLPALVVCGCEALVVTVESTEEEVQQAPGQAAREERGPMVDAPLPRSDGRHGAPPGPRHGRPYLPAQRHGRATRRRAPSGRLRGVPGCVARHPSALGPVRGRIPRGDRAAPDRLRAHPPEPGGHAADPLQPSDLPAPPRPGVGYLAQGRARLVRQPARTLARPRHPGRGHRGHAAARSSTPTTSPGSCRWSIRSNG